MYRRGIGTKRHQEWKRGTTDGKVMKSKVHTYMQILPLFCLPELPTGPTA